MLKVGFAAHLFFDHMPIANHLYNDIESRLAGPLPQVELLACEPAGADRLRIVIDHPDGVSLGLCERVTHELGELLNDYALEVASPGPERPLTRPEHFRRFIGRRARVRTRQPLEGFGRDAASFASVSESGRDAESSASASGRKSFTGELVGASEEEVALAVPARDGPGGVVHQAGVVTIPYAQIARSNLLKDSARTPNRSSSVSGDAARTLKPSSQDRRER